MTLSEYWASIYWTFPDNAFDYVGKPFIIDEDEIIFDGRKYVEVPF